MKIRIEPADKYFSLCVRERAGNQCEYEGCRRTSEHYRIDCSHLFSRRHNSTRYDPNNAVAHCFLHHQQLGGDPVEFTRWAEARFGPQKIQELRVRAMLALKLSKVDKAFIAKHYRAEHARMRSLRDRGAMGYLTFKGWGES